jgi:effector-binding domain-containing protein
MVETAPYEESGTIGDVELRKYPAVRVASVRGVPEDEAFGFLFRYISGRNRTQKKISMTAPVITSETIAMTAPVISDDTTMSFVMPGSYSLDDLPEPLDAEVQIREIPSRDVAVIRFRGTADEASVAGMTRRLMETLRENTITVTGKPFLMRYNPPFIPGMFRRNEVGVEIRMEG